MDAPAVAVPQQATSSVHGAMAYDRRRHPKEHPLARHERRRVSRARATVVTLAASAVIASVAVMPGVAVAQPEQHQFDLWDIKLGTPAAALPEDAFIDFACGTNGGPPGQRLKGFTDFAQCRAETTGLYEVHVRYDDELEYWARAHDYPELVERYGGTRALIYPVVLSVLFDDHGVVRGVRAVTDSRASLRRRGEAYGLARDVQTRLGREGWNCVDLPRGPGEEPMGQQFVKRICDKATPIGFVIVEARLFRKPGQSTIDPQTGVETLGSFESWAKVEIFDPRFAARGLSVGAPAGP